MQRSARLFLVTLAAAAAASTRALAQSISFLQPDRYQLADEGEVAVHVSSRTAEALRAVAWPARDLDWFYFRTAGTQENIDAANALKPGEEFVRLALHEPDAALIGIDRKPWIEQVSGADLRKFLELDVAPGAMPADWRERSAKETLRVRHVECAKLFVRMTKTTGEGKDAWKGSATAPSKVGQRSEIRPLTDPTTIALGSDLPLRIAWADSASPDVMIVARQPAAGTRLATLAKHGAGWFTVNASGEWLVEVHRAKALTGDPTADWELESATISFVAPAAAKTAGGGK